MNYNPYSQNQNPFTPTLTPMVKWLMIGTTALWLFFQLIAEGYAGWPVSKYLALFPGKVVEDFYVWQVFTYMFLHTMSVSHILLNMLSLWFIGAELEKRWGGRFFLFYYLASGAGAALFYCLGIVIYTVFTGHQVGLRIPVMGASGAIFGLLLAYGILFGERTLHFMMLFPMKAKMFVLILAGVEIVSLLGSGVTGGEVANLAHLGGFAAGYLTLLGFTKWKRYKWDRKSNKKGRNLRLVVDNDNIENKTGNSPKYWN